MDILFPTDTPNVTPASDDRFLISDTSNGGEASDAPLSDLPISTATQTALNSKESTSNKGIANGYAPLDATGKVPAANLPASGGGTVDSVVAGTNIAVDDTDVANPVVSLSLGADENFATDAEKTKLSNLSGTNTGDQDLSALATKSELAGYALNCDNQSAITDYTFTGSERRNSGYLVTTASNRTVNIDADLFSTGYEVTICKGTNNANTATLDAQAGNNINGIQTFVLTQYNETVTLIKDGNSTWKIKSHYYPISGTNTGNETASSIGSLINSSSAATPNDTDLVATAVSAGSLVSITWTNVKAFLKTYFDTLYITGNQSITLSGDVTGSGTTAITGTLANTAVTPGSYTTANITVDSKGRITEAANGSSSGSSLWTAVTGTRTGNTTFTVTGDVTATFSRGLVIKWTESSSVKCGYVVSSSFSSITTVTIIGDAMASIDSSSLKWTSVPADKLRFAVAGAIGTVATDVANTQRATEALRVLGANLWAGTAGTTNSTTIDLNKAGTTMFTTKPTFASTVAYSSVPFTADSGISLSIGDAVTEDVDAVQTTPAVDLYSELIVFPVRILNLS